MYLQISNYIEQKSDALTKKIERFIRRENITLSEFAGLAVTAVILYLSPMTNFFITIDDELAAFRMEPAIWLQEGRWFAYLLEKFVFQQPTLPYIHEILFSVSVSLSYMLVVRAINFPMDWRSYLIFPIYCAFPIWRLIGGFYANLPSVNMGLILVSVSAFLYSRSYNVLSTNKTLLWGRMFVQSVFLSIAFGGYQAFLMFFFAVGVGVVYYNERLIPIIRERGFYSYFYPILHLGIVLIMSLVLYFGAQQALVAIVSIEDLSGHVLGYLDFSQLKSDPTAGVMAIFNQVVSYYFLTTNTYGTSQFFVSVVVVFSCLILFFRSWSMGWHRVIFSISIWVVLLVSPFLPSITGKWLPIHSLLTIPVVIWLMFTLFYTEKLKLFFIAFSLLSIFQILVTNSTYSALSISVQQHDRALAEDLYNRIALLDKDFSRDEIVYIDIFGNRDIKTVYNYPISKIYFSSFYSLNPFVYRITTYMSMLGYTNVVPYWNEERIKLTPVFENMPVYPAAGSVIKFGEVYLIKLGNEPDVVHAEYYK